EARRPRHPGSGSGRREGSLEEARAPGAETGVSQDPGRRSRRRREGAGAAPSRGSQGPLKFLVFIEQREGKIRKASLEALSLARKLSGAPAAAVIAGKGVAPLAKDLGKYGAGVVYVGDRDDLALYSTKGYVGALDAAARLSRGGVASRRAARRKPRPSTRGAAGEGGPGRDLRIEGARRLGSRRDRFRRPRHQGARELADDPRSAGGARRRARSIAGRRRRGMDRPPAPGGTDRQGRFADPL